MQNLFLICVMLAPLLISCAPHDSEGGEPQVRFVPQRPDLSPDLITNLINFTDVLRTDSLDLEHQLNLPALTAVTREFGPTVITQKTFPFTSVMSVSSITPWSSWWYPKKEDSLFSTKAGAYSSVLNKYDIIRKRRYERSHGGAVPESAAGFESKSYNRNSLSWEGLCDAWSLAAISSPEPKRPVAFIENGLNIKFSVGDLKALLLMTYSAVDDSNLTYYGQKFTGDDNGWIFPDIFPDQFHRYLEVRLAGAKLPFIMDHDPGVQVWNVPVYKANYVMDQIPGQPNSVFVRAWLFSAESVLTNERDFVGTKQGIREYDYVLSGSRNAQGDLVVDSGYWVVGPTHIDSRADHPDYLTSVTDPKKLIRKSWNPEIDIKLVDEILAKSF